MVSHVHSWQAFKSIYTMKTYVILLGLMLQVLAANANNRYWVGTSSSDWNDKNNWASVSGGAGGAGIPGALDAVIFDNANTPYNCVLNNAATIGSITISAGAFSLGASADLTLQDKFAILGGSFDAGTGKLRITSSQVSTIGGGVFNANQASIYLNANLTVTSLSAFKPGTSTVTMNSGTYNVTLNDNAGGCFKFYNLVINKGSDNETSRFEANVASDSFQIDNLITLTNGQIAGGGFMKLEKDLSEASTFDGASISIACTGPNTSNLTLDGPLAAGGYNSFVGIVKSTSATVVNVYRGSEAGANDTIKIGNGGNFTVRRGIIQFPDGSPIISFFNNLIIEPGGTFKSTSNHFYNKGGHINYGGQFLHNNGTYVFANANVNYTELTNHVENFYNLKLNCSRIEPKSKDTLVINGTLTLLTGIIAGPSNPDATVVLKGDLNATAAVPAQYLQSLNILISGSGDQHFYNANAQNVDLFNCPITIDKPSGAVILDAPFIVSGWGTQALNFKNGIIKSATDDYFLQMDGGKITGASNSSHIDGPFKYKSVWTPVELPVGNGGYYAPVRITEQGQPSAPSAYFTVRYFRKSPSPLYDITKKDDPVNLQSISNCEYWTIDREAGNTTSAYVWLSYDSKRSCGATDQNKLRVARWNGSQWTNGGGSSSGQYVMSGTYYSGFGPYTLASVDGSLQNGVLPVTFLSFKVTDNNGKAYVQWATANEVNNNYFEVERCSDGRSFQAIAKVYPKEGNVAATKNYSFVDQNVSDAATYYRIKQVDIDGNVHYSSIATYNGVDDRSACNVSYSRSLKLCTVFFDLPSGQNVDASIYGINGQLVLKRSFITDGSDRRQYLLNAAPGVYFVKIATQANVWTKQFIIQ